MVECTAFAACDARKSKHIELFQQSIIPLARHARRKRGKNTFYPKAHAYHRTIRHPRGDLATMPTEKAQGRQVNSCRFCAADWGKPSSCESTVPVFIYQH
jgi:hypothetical protein